MRKQAVANLCGSRAIPSAQMTRWVRLPRIPVLLLVILSIGIVSIAAAQEELDDYNLAIGFYKKERWELAVGSFQKFLKQNPTHAKAPYARLYLGMALRNQKKYDESRKILREFVARHQKNKNLPYAMFRVAECSYFLEDLKAAEGEFQAFYKKYAKHDLNEWALPNLADIELRLNKPKEAAANFRTALARYPSGQMAEDSRFGLARSLEMLKQYPEAIKLYEELAADQAGSFAAQAQSNLATRYFESGDYRKAAAEFLELEQNFAQSRLVPLARLNGGFAYYQLGEYRKAIEKFESAESSEDHASTAEFWIGMSHKSLGEYDQAGGRLKKVFAADPQGPLAEEALYHRADCELRSSRYETARQLFLEVVSKWPQGNWADDALYFSAESALQEKRLDETEQLLTRFNSEYPRSPLRSNHELLTGRLFVARGGEENQKKAIVQFQKIISRRAPGKTDSFARFYLAGTQRKLGNHTAAIATIAPLAEQVMREGADPEFAESLILYGNSLLMTGSYKKSIAPMSKYLGMRPNGEHADEAYSTLALAHVHLTNKAESRVNLEKLTKNFPDSPLTADTTHQVAEIAFAADDWSWASSLFTSLEDFDRQSPYHPIALSGVAWCDYRLEKYQDAAAGFDRLLKAYPNNLEFAPEASYMRGKSFYDSGNLLQAAAAFASALVRFAPENAKPGEEKEGAASYAYLSGLQAARTWRKLEKITEADAAYESLLKRFPQPGSLDKLLDEWALLNYEAENFDRADELFRRLIKETPSSDLVDDARLSLAESEHAAGRLEAAQKAFSALESDAKASPAVQDVSLQHLISIGIERHQWKEIVHFSQQLQTRFPKSDFQRDAQFYLAEAQLNLGDLKVAGNTLQDLKGAQTEEAVRRADWFPRIWVLLAEISFRHKKYDEVKQAVDDLKRVLPDSPLIYQADDVLGRSYKNQAKFDEARTAFLRVVEDKSGRRTETAAKCQLLIADTYMMQKDYPQAQREYFKVYHLYQFPDWQAPALYQAAVCDEALKKPEQAARTYGDLIKEFPTSEFAEKARKHLPDLQKNASK